VKLSILHIAPQNTAGVPFEVVKEERRRGINSRLITMWRHPYGFEEDECLELPLVAGGFVKLMQRVFGTTPKTVSTRKTDLADLPPKWRGDRFPVEELFSLRDFFWEKKLRKAGFPARFDDYDIIMLDGGMPLLRAKLWELDWVKKGGKLAVTYYGSDLRQRGVIPEIDNAAGAVFVFEFDHRFLHPRAKWLPFPFSANDLPKANPTNGKIRIGHVATNRSAKGTNFIIETLNELAKKRDIEPVIIKRVPHDETLKLKASCHIFIDQLSELGYGISGLESLAMGIPTVVELWKDHEEFIGENPFIVANKNNLFNVLDKLIADKELRETLSQRGPEWVARFHNPARTLDIIMKEYNNIGWIT